MKYDLVIQFYLLYNGLLKRIIMKNFILLTFILLSANLYGYTFQDAKQACTKKESSKVLKIYDELMKVDNYKAKKELFLIYS